VRRIPNSTKNGKKWLFHSWVLSVLPLREHRMHIILVEGMQLSNCRHQIGQLPTFPSAHRWKFAESKSLVSALSYHLGAVSIGGGGNVRSTTLEHVLQYDSRCKEERNSMPHDSH
jgi:hypothetical protein